MPQEPRSGRVQDIVYDKEISLSQRIKMTKEKGHWYSSALSVGGVFLASVGGSYVLYKYLSRETFDSSSQLETVSEPYGADRTELLQYIQQSTLKNCTCDELMEVFGSSKCV
mmetsp:Transcript_23527/g.39773  ORF Transcript_23527/g.39773 Transcript_23527/m.39773 type:complete len:112 (-) Transcript_23527:430-765(-)